MKCFRIKQEQLFEYMVFFPKEMLPLLTGKNQDLHFIGVEFLGEPYGALIWEKTVVGGILHSIYVKPMGRRLGLGKAMMRELSVQMVKERCAELTFTYEEWDERVSLTPFFTACGAFLKMSEMPLGVTSLGEAAEKLKNHGVVYTDERCRPVYRLTPSELLVCEKWLLHELAVPLRRYEEKRPASYVILEDGVLKGAMLLREYDGKIGLEYCWNGSGQPLVLVQLFSAVVAELSRQYTPDTPIEMVLASTQGEQLFRKLIGNADGRVLLCLGTFSPQPLRLLV